MLMGVLFDEFEESSGVLQGNLLSPLLFALLMVIFFVCEICNRRRKRALTGKMKMES